jgi:hypothetical protein
MNALASLFPDRSTIPRKRPDYYTRCGSGKRPRFATFDFETDGLGGRVTAASYMTEQMLEEDIEPGYICKGDIVQKMFSIMCNNSEYQWFAHNMQYEARYFIERLEELKDRVNFYLRTDSDVFMITLDLPEVTDAKGKSGILYIRDSMALWGESLAKFADQFCPELPKLHIDFETTTFDPFNPDHEAYSKRDSLSLLLCLTRLNDLLFQNFDVNIRSTIASTALAAWQRTLRSTDKFYNPKATEDFIRTGYYGGLVFLTDTCKYREAKTYDRNSSYPAEMMEGEFPLGAPVRCNKISDEYLGLYTVTVTAPPGIIVPILPKRDDKGIIWPSGTFETTVTSDELNFARLHGYIVNKVREGLIWYETCSPFNVFIMKCRTIRFDWPGTALERIAKLMQNSVYGKYGSKRLRRKIYGSLPEGEELGCEPWGEFLIKEEYSDDMQCMPQWAVFITARARLALLGKIYEVGAVNVLYGDTDSITVKPGYSIDTGKEYGQWKLEKVWSEFRARGPKIYAGRKADDLDITGAAKGIPRRHWKTSGIFDAILEGTDNAVVQYKTLEKFVVGLKTGYIGQRDAHRNLSSLANSRSWKLQGDGTVRPRSWEEIELRNYRKRSRVL